MLYVNLKMVQYNYVFYMLCQLVADLYNAGTQDLLAVMTATKEITDWSVLALYLGISKADYEKMKQNSNAQGCNLHQDVISKWFDNGRASWAVLVKCLREELVGKTGLAHRIAWDHRKLCMINCCS